MKIEVLEFWAALVLIVAYITAAMLRRGAGSITIYRRGLFHLCIAFFMMEVVPPILILINGERKPPSDLLMVIGIICLIIAVLVFLNSLRLLCNWLLGDRDAP